MGLYVKSIAHPLLSTIIQLITPQQQSNTVTTPPLFLLSHHIRRAVQWDRVRECVVQDTTDDALDELLRLAAEKGLCVRQVAESGDTRIFAFCFDKQYLSSLEFSDLKPYLDQNFQ
eukprot:c18758_g1_i1.p1 GENE.c18758_g1_i1~~c18758_g1_i1.p1  ORF type:complete len:116 (+),score=22.77 c18758_g1_i1:2-349(+)